MVVNLSLLCSYYCYLVLLIKYYIKLCIFINYLLILLVVVSFISFFIVENIPFLSPKLPPNLLEFLSLAGFIIIEAGIADVLKINPELLRLNILVPFLLELILLILLLIILLFTPFWILLMPLVFSSSFFVLLVIEFRPSEPEKHSKLFDISFSSFTSFNSSISFTSLISFNSLISFTSLISSALETFGTKLPFDTLFSFSKY